MNLSRERTIFVYYRFFRQSRNRYGRRPIFTYGARWYNNDACKWLRLKHAVYENGLKNLTERFLIQQIRRTECFDDHFPSRRRNCNIHHVWNWLKSVVLCLHMSSDTIQLITFLVVGGRLSNRAV